MKRTWTVILALLSLTALSSSGVRPGGPVRQARALAPDNPFTLLHSFSGAITDGASPRAGMVTDGTKLYGTTNGGGTTGLGIVFSMDTDGSDFTILRSFGSIAGDGIQPWNTLIRSGSTLYGTTRAGGPNSYGTIFKIDTNGENYAILHGFGGGTSDGSYPLFGPLVLSGSCLYGMTSAGGPTDQGTIYKYDLSEGTFTVIRSFAGGTSDGCSPEGGLLLVGSTLYGMTFGGGSASNAGTVFKIDTDGNNYAILRAFTAGSADGGWPHDGLITDGTKLYGMTCQGGPSNWGTLFSMDLNGSNFQGLHYFGGAVANPGYPLGTPVLSGGMLYGMTAMGGTSDRGTLFSFDTTDPEPTTNFKVLHDFAGGTTDGGVPYAGAPILSGSTLYGTTKEYGASSLGTVFSFALSPDISLDLYSNDNTPDPYAEITITLDVTNQGLSAATGVEVTYQLPPALTYVSHIAGQGDYDPQYGTWTVGAVAAGETVTLSLTVKVTSSGTIMSTATKTAMNETDADTANDYHDLTLTTVPNKTLLVPILGTPLNGATDTLTSVLLKWRDTNTTPQEVKYKVRIKKAGGSYVNVNVPSGTNSYNKTNLTPGKTYYWNVMAVGNGTSTKNSPWANGGVDFSFTVEPPVTLNPPNLIDPANNAAGQPLTVTLLWEDTNFSPDEFNYKVRFKVAGGTYTTVTLAPGTTAYLKTGLRPGKTYYWSVMAVGSGAAVKSSAWPADFKFTTS